MSNDQTKKDLGIIKTMVLKVSPFINGLPLHVQLDENLRCRDHKGTQYEREHNINFEKATLILDHPELKMVVERKDDGSDTLQIYFKVNRSSDLWLRWNPSISQANILIQEFPRIFQSLKTTYRHRSD